MTLDEIRALCKTKDWNGKLTREEIKFLIEIIFKLEVQLAKQHIKEREFMGLSIES